MSQRPTIDTPLTAVRLRSCVIRMDGEQYLAFWSDREGIHLVMHIADSVTAVEHWPNAQSCWRQFDQFFNRHTPEGRRKSDLLYAWLFKPRPGGGR